MSLERAAARLLVGSALVMTVATACTVDAAELTTPTVSPISVAPTASSEPTPSPTPVPTRPPAPRSTSTPVPLTNLTETPTPTPTEPELDAVVEAIPDEQWERMVSSGTWRPGCPVGRDDLRRLTLTHLDFSGEPRRGVLVVNADVVDDLIEIFGIMLDAGFPIAQMRPVERYDGEVNASLGANNTSAFNCRKPGQINAPVTLSPHANGRAIDINPVLNPWRDPRCNCWSPTDEYAAATSGPGIIRESSQVIDLFEERGWIWQDIDVTDYMHFDTGFPSKPWGEGS